MAQECFSPETVKSDYVDVWSAFPGTITEIVLVRSSSRSEHTQARGMPCAYLPVSHSVREDDGTGSAMRKCVLRPSAIVPTRCHVPYCALRAEARCGVHAEHDAFSPRRRPGPPARSPGDSAADHAVLGAAEWHRAVVKLVLSRDSWLQSGPGSRGHP